jgi:hypothetical protein
VERQKQLLGIDDGNTMDLVAEAIDFSHTRRKSDLRRLIDRAKSGTHKPPREQVRAQIVKVLQNRERAPVARDQRSG